MPNAPNTKALKAYNIIRNYTANTAEIAMYGDVLESRPVDWWTGEPIPGPMILLDEFLADLDQLAGCSEITVRINSGGGDMYAGVTIYQRLRELSGNVITVVDGLAASAASVIFMAGSIRRVHSGSNVMIHSAAFRLSGAYQLAALDKVRSGLIAHNQAAACIYSEVTGKPEADILAMMEAETWFPGKTAVDEGFATELYTVPAGSAVALKLTPDRSRLMLGDRAVASARFRKVPDAIPAMSEAEFAALNNSNNPQLEGVALLLHNYLKEV